MVVVDVDAGERTLGGTRSMRHKGNILVSWLTATDHKVIAYLYLDLPTPSSFGCIGRFPSADVRGHAAS
ncbi:hypothetical protein GCM10027414_34960 [Humibacter ginsengiterrae]